MEGIQNEDLTIAQHETSQGGEQKQNISQENEAILLAKSEKTASFVQKKLEDAGLGHIKAVGFIKQENVLGNPTASQKPCIRLEQNGNPMTDMFFNLEDYQNNDELEKDLRDRLLGSGEIEIRQRSDNAHEPGVAGE